MNEEESFEYVDFEAPFIDVYYIITDSLHQFFFIQG